MKRLLVALTLATSVAAAQETPSPPKLGSIRGVVLDAATAAPMPETMVAAGGESGGGGGTTTDAQGRYTIRDLPPGRYQMQAGRGNSAPRKWVTVNPGQDVGPIEFRVAPGGTITGRILDQNGDPLPAVMVWLVQRVYSRGDLRESSVGSARSNDRGEYRITDFVPGRTFTLRAANWLTSMLQGISAAPADPKLRKPVIVPTYYGGSTSIEGAQTLVLRSGETREGVDIRVTRSPSFCVEGVQEAAAGVRLTLYRQGSAVAGALLKGAGEKFRICDLGPGQYELRAEQPAATSEPLFGEIPVMITDQDIRNIRPVAQPGITLSGVVLWDGTPPEKDVESGVKIALQPLNRSIRSGERLTVQSNIPGEFSFPSLLLSDYTATVSGLARGWYVKDITFAGNRVLHSRLRMGSAAGSSMLRVTVARDGGVVSVRVNDKDGQAVDDAYVCVAPAEVGTEAALASHLSYSQTDQNGAYTTSTLAPGKYWVFASRVPYDMSLEMVGKLWRARNKAKQVDVGAGATVQVTLEPVALE